MSPTATCPVQRPIGPVPRSLGLTVQAMKAINPEVVFPHCFVFKCRYINDFTGCSSTLLRSLWRASVPVDKERNKDYIPGSNEVDHSRSRSLFASLQIMGSSQLYSSYHLLS